MSTMKLKLTAAEVVVVLAGAGTWFGVAAEPGGSQTVPSPGRADKPSAGASKLTAKQWARSAENLKEIVLAVHRFHETYGHLPADVYSKDGKPL